MLRIPNSVLPYLPNPKFEKRFWSKVELPDCGYGCWLWKGTINPVTGYGAISITCELKKHKGLSPHRVAYELIKGPIPVGLDLDHLCRNPPCVNPAHLEPVTRKENLLRGVGTFQAQYGLRTHCAKGHPLSGENLRIGWAQIRDAPRYSFRICLTCRRAAQREARYKLLERMYGPDWSQSTH